MYIHHAALLIFAMSANATAGVLVLQELPAKEYCQNAPTTGVWSDMDGHCRFALIEGKELAAVVSVGGEIIKANHISTSKKAGSAHKGGVGEVETMKFSNKSHSIEVVLKSTVIENTCADADGTCCGVSYRGELTVTYKDEKAVLELSRYDGA